MMGIVLLTIKLIIWPVELVCGLAFGGRSNGNK